MSKLRDKIQIQDQDSEEVEIDLLELFQYFRSQILILIIALLVGGVAAGAITHFLITPKYQATSKLYVVSASNNKIVDLNDLNIGTSLSEDYTELIKIRPILEDVIKDCNLDYEYEELLEMLTIAPVGETRILAITVESTSAKEAMTIANSVAATAVTYLPKLMETTAPNIAEKAVLPEGPCSPNLVTNTAIGAIGMLVLVMAVLTVLFLMDDTMRSAEEVEKAFGVMPLTVIPEGDIAKSPIKERKRSLRRRRKLTKSARKPESKRKKTIRSKNKTNNAESTALMQSIKTKQTVRQHENTKESAR